MKDRRSHRLNDRLGSVYGAQRVGSVAWKRAHSGGILPEGSGQATPFPSFFHAWRFSGRHSESRPITDGIWISFDIVRYQTRTFPRVEVTVMIFRSCVVILLTLPLIAQEANNPLPPADQNRPVTVQTTTTQTWVPGRWVRVDIQDVWQPGHWETVQTSTTLPTASAAIPMPAPVQIAQNTASPAWISERWEQTPDGWNRYAGRWSTQPDVIVERRPIELPTRTVVVERPVTETVVVERPVYTSSMTVGMSWNGNRSSGWGMGVGYGFPLWPAYSINHCRPSYSHHAPICRPVHHASPTISIGARTGFTRHR